MPKRAPGPSRAGRGASDPAAVDRGPSDPAPSDPTKGASLSGALDDASGRGWPVVEGFVVWLDPIARSGPRDAPFRGVVERMADSVRTRFDSVEVLVAVLRGRSAPPSVEDVEASARSVTQSIPQRAQDPDR